VKFFLAPQVGVTVELSQAREAGAHRMSLVKARNLLAESCH
jgi:hypothetical protein